MVSLVITSNIFAKSLPLQSPKQEGFISEIESMLNCGDTFWGSKNNVFETAHPLVSVICIVYPPLKVLEYPSDVCTKTP